MVYKSGLSIVREIQWYYCILFILLCATFRLPAMAQCRTSAGIWNELQSIENNKTQANGTRISEVLKLKKEFERCGLAPDSVYARILHRAALYEYLINKNSPSNLCIEFTLQASHINTSEGKRGSRRFAINSFSNLAMFYKDLRLYDKALDYYDSTIILVKEFPDQYRFVLSSRYDRSEIFYHIGNYQQSIDESSAGFLESAKRSDTSWMLSFLNQKAQSHYYQGQLEEATRTADRAVNFASLQVKQHNKHIAGKDIETANTIKQIHYELATAFKTKALIYEQMGMDSLAGIYFRQTIGERTHSVVNDDFGQVAGDYNDFGNFLMNSSMAFSKADACYRKTLEYATIAKDNERISKAYLNLGQSGYRQHDYDLAKTYYVKSFTQLGLPSSPDFLLQPVSTQLNRIVDKEFVLVYLRNRMELLIGLFKESGDHRYLDRALATAYLNDTLITRIRHEQSGEQSKLYWRNFTRESYAFAMEIAYLIRDPAVSFFFMEKSRAVLLNDKLNELGAFAYLPTQESVRELELRNAIIQQEQTVAAFPSDNGHDEPQQLKLLNAKEEFSRYIKSLEVKYPSYYQYKYADEVPSLEELKKYLSANQQSFVHYFMGDTVTYVLGIWGNRSKMLRIGRDQFRLSQITELLGYVSDKQLLNNHYADFASLSHQLYTHLFAPLGLPKGRVVICPDNFLFPFEAFSTDASGKQMLIKDYAISYIYSARYLLKQFPEYVSSGNFIGFAPVSFRPGLGLADLTNSAVSLQDASANYHHPVMYAGREATRRSFLSNVGNYRTVTIFSHARANEGDEEPMLYMQDSVIRLSELQYLNHPGTRLVVLSACQTTAGRNATGEGIYSLARGFAAAGIPSVAATVWKADEETIYSISKLFHQYLSQGMRKDEALQKAKLEFMNGADREQMLPYYWANMIIMGNPQAIRMDADSIEVWHIALPLLTTALLLGFLYIGYRKRVFS